MESMKTHSPYPERSEQLISLEKGKLPPQAVDLEEVVLGAMLIDKRGVDEAIAILKPNFFYKEAHQHIFTAIDQLYENQNPVDIMTVSAELKKMGKLDAAGGEFNLVQLTQAVASSAHIEFHSRIVMQKFMQREVIKISNLMIEDAYDETTDVFDLVDNAYDHLNKISEVQASSNESIPSDLMGEVIQKGKDIFSGKVKPGIETPIKRLTNKAGGWRDGELIIMAARPGMGKTSFALLSAYLPAKAGIPTAFFSLEMAKKPLVARLISMEARVNSNKFNTHGLDDHDLERIEKVKAEIQKAKLYIDDTAELTIKTLRIKVKRLIQKYGVEMVVIDYLQLMEGNEKNREQEISKISRGLKLLTQEMQIPIIALSQLSRGVETRGGSKRPLLSDLRESGAIEQDADMVMFFYRPEYYRIKEWDDYGQGPTVGEAEYIVAKNRNGGLVRNRMKFEAEFTKFSDMEEEDEQAPIEFPEEDNDDLPF